MRYVRPRKGEPETALAARVLARAALCGADALTVAQRVYARPATARPGEVQFLAAIEIGRGL